MKNKKKWGKQMKIEKEKIGEKITNIAEKAKQGGENISKKQKNSCKL